MSIIRNLTSILILNTFPWLLWFSLNSSVFLHIVFHFDKQTVELFLLLWGRAYKRNLMLQSMRQSKIEYFTFLFCIVSLFSYCVVFIFSPQVLSILTFSFLILKMNFSVKPVKFTLLHIQKNPSNITAKLRFFNSWSRNQT